MKKKIIPWVFLAPSLAGVTVFTGIPFLDVIRRSFFDTMGKTFLGLTNYRTVWDNRAFRLAAGNTLRFLVVCIPLLMTISLSLALILYGKAKEGKSYGVMRATMVLPMAIPAASMVLVWKILLCQEGVFNQWLSGITGQPWQVDWAFSGYAFPILTATYLWKHTGYDMILWLAGLAGIPGEMYEAARIDGAGAAARFWYITVPQLSKTFCLVTVLSVVNSFRVYREAYLLAGSYPDSSIYLVPHVFAHWFLSLDIQKMTAAAVMLTCSFLIPTAGVWALRRRL